MFLEATKLYTGNEYYESLFGTKSITLMLLLSDGKLIMFERLYDHNSRESRVQTEDSLMIDKVLFGNSLD